MLFERGVRVAVTIEAKGVKACLDTDLKIGALAAVALNAAIQSAIVDKIVMAARARHLDVLGVGEVERQ